MFDNTTLACARLAERATTPVHEANNAALKFFSRVRESGISLSDIMTGDAENETTPSSELLKQKAILATENASLKRVVSKLEKKSSTLETRLAAVRAEITGLRSENTNLRVETAALRKPTPSKPEVKKIKAKDGFVAYGEFHMACDTAFGHKSGWKMALSEIAGVKISSINGWKLKGVPEKMLDYLPALVAASKDKDKDKYSWSTADRDELVRFYNSGPKAPTYSEMAVHMTAFLKHDINVNSISGKMLGVPRRHR